MLYTVASLFQSVDDCSQALDDNNLRTFAKCYTALESFVERNQRFRDLFRCLDLKDLLARSEKVKNENLEYLNSISLVLLIVRICPAL